MPTKRPLKLAILGAFALIFSSACQDKIPANSDDSTWPEIDPESQKIINGEGPYQLDSSKPVPREYLARYGQAYRVYYALMGLSLEPESNAAGGPQDPKKNPRKSTGSEIPRPDLYEEIKRKTFKSVTNDFGDVIINLNQLNNAVAEVRTLNQKISDPSRRMPEEWRLEDVVTQIPERGITKFEPWSSYFFPANNDVLFTREKRKLTSDERDKVSRTGFLGLGGKVSDTWISPLRQYDHFSRKEMKNSSGSAADWEENNYKENAKAIEHWYGLCHAWSLATFVEDEPKNAVYGDIDGEFLSLQPGDIKALILKKYQFVEESAFKMYGQRFDGSPDENTGLSPDYEDLYPEQVHRFIDAVLYGNRWPAHMGRHVPRPFIMDYDARQDVWSVPVYSGRLTIRPATQGGAPVKNAVLVRLDLYAADSYHNADERFQMGLSQLNKVYYYALYGDYDDTSGNLHVHSGIWLNRDIANSAFDHPDFFLYIDDVRKIRPIPPGTEGYPINPHLNYSNIDRLVNLAR